MQKFRRFLLRATAAVAWVPIIFFLNLILEKTKVLDDFADRVGDWLKISITTRQVEWIVAFVILVMLYLVLFWQIWRNRKVEESQKSDIDPTPSTQSRGNSTGIRIMGNGNPEVSGNKITGADTGIEIVGHGSPKIDDNEIR